MSFETITFAYTPPPTISEQEPTVAEVVTAPPETSTVQPANQSVAASLAAQLGDLIDTSGYLQSVIMSLHQGLGITVDQSNPDLAMALSTIYNGQVPPAVSLLMYSNTLDAELGSLQVNLAIGPNAGIEANSFQQQALTTINKSFESQMSADGSVAAQSALLLRPLKAGALMNTTIQGQLMEYPSATPAPSTPSLNVVTASGIDISSDTAALVQSNIDSTGQVYSSMYQVIAQPDPIAADVASVVNSLATVAVPDLIRMSAVLSMAAQSLSVCCGKSLSTGISAFIFPQVVSQASGLMMQLDRIVQMAVAPLSTTANAVSSAVSALSGAMKSVGSLVGIVRSMKLPAAANSSCPLPGMPSNNSAVSGLPIGSPMPTAVANLGFSSGINELSSIMSFCTSQVSSVQATQQDAFQRLAARVSGDQAKSTQMLAATTSMSSLGSLITAFINKQQNSSAISSQSASTQLATVGGILSSAQTGSGSSYVVQNGVVSVIPLAVPPVTPGAATVFAKSGIRTSLTGLN